jgi:AcrR family transcriptional regulator
MEGLSRVATERFLESGYEALSIDALVQEVGGSKRNVYDHFKGKEGLFIKVVEDLCAELSQPLLKTEISEEEPRVALAKYSAELINIVLEPRALALHRLMIAEAERFPELARAIWNAGHDGACRRLAKWISVQQKNKFITSRKKAEFLSQQFISMVTGYAQLKALLAVNTPAWPKKEISAHIADTVDSFLSGNSTARSE